MSKNKRKKSPKKVAPPKSSAMALPRSFLEGWSNSFPIIKFVLLFGLLLLIFYALYGSNFFQEAIVVPAVNFQAIFSNFVLNLLSQDTVVNGGIISNELGSINVGKGCDGIEAIMLYVIGVLVVPFSFKTKWPGLLFGFLALFLLNMIRIIGLFFANIYFPEAFETLHLHGGFALFIVVTLILWLIWANWALAKDK